MPVEDGGMYESVVERIWLILGLIVWDKIGQKQWNCFIAKVVMNP